MTARALMLVALATPVAEADSLLLLLLLPVLSAVPLAPCGTVPVAFEPALLVALPSARITTYISPVVSELMNRRPSLSQAKPTGLKQTSLVHEVTSAFERMSMAAVLLVLGSTGSPFSNSMTLSL